MFLFRRLSFAFSFWLCLAAQLAAQEAHLPASEHHAFAGFAADFDDLPKSWSGSYVGIFVGDSSSHSSTNLTATQNPIHLSTGQNKSSFDKDLSTAGLFLGRNLQMHRGLIGLEGEASTQAITTTAQLTTSTAADISARTDQTFFARGRARLGYLIYPQVLIFTAVGLSLAQTNYADQLTSQTLPHPEMNSQKINAGVNFGFGTEYAFNHKIFVRLDYLHDAFRDRDANGLITPQENLNHRSILTTNIFRGGVSYKF